MSIHIQPDNLQTATLLLTFLPMIVAAVFAVLCFHRAGYGLVGKLLVGGFSLLVMSLFLGLMFNIERETIYRSLAGLTRMIGWGLIAAAFVMWYLELERSLP